MIPLSTQRLQTLFKESSKNATIIGRHEGYALEFKESFGWQSRNEYLRSMAAFANHSGGYILFCIKRTPNTFIGLSDEALERFNNIDDAQWSALIRSYFAPAFIWEKTTFTYKGMDFGVFYAHMADEKPIICRISEGKLRKSAIYYRYKAETTEIDYPELNRIIENEKRKINDMWMQKIKQIETAGIAKTAILNLETGKVDGTNTSLYIDKALLNQIEFINEGTFVDTGGSPVLKIVGDVQPVELGPTVVVETEREFVLNYDVLFNKLFDQGDVVAPEEYIRQACYIPASTIPIYYFIHKAGLSMTNAIAILDAEANAPSSKRYLRKRLQERVKRHVPLSTLNTGAADHKRSYYEALVNENLVLPDTKEKIKYVLLAIRALDKDKVTQHKEYILSLSKQLYSRWYPEQDNGFRGLLREAFCWLDEALFMPE